MTGAPNVDTQKNSKRFIMSETNLVLFSGCSKSFYWMGFLALIKHGLIISSFFFELLST